MLRRLLFVAALPTVLLGCGGDGAPSTGGTTPTATLTVSLNRDSLRAGEAAQATAEGRDERGQPWAAGTLAWSSSDAAIATVSRTGFITSRAPGTAQIVASSGTLRGQATLRVFGIPVNAVVVTPLRSVIAPGERTQLSARAIDATGATLSGRRIAWLSSDTTRADVDDNGLVTGRSPGVVSIAAISEEAYTTVDVRVSGPPGPVATVTVTPAALGLFIGQSGPLSATLEDADGNEATDRPVTWESLAPAIATVSPGGVVTAIARGTARVRATSEGKTAFADVSVSDLADSISIAFAEPVKDDIIGDTLRLFTDIKSRHKIVRASARVVTTEVFEGDLVETPVGSLGTRFAWTGALDVTFLRYGPYQVVVTAIDSLGNRFAKAQSFTRGAREGKGGTTIPPRNK